MSIEIYSKSVCGYCRKAKDLLKRKGVEFVEIDVTNPKNKLEMLDRVKNARTVPQIFIHGEHIGGCDELYALERSGKLDTLLSK